MRHIAALALTLFAGPLAAQDWQPVTDDAALSALLIDHPLVYETGATQVFHATGRTLYAYGEPSWGYWRIAAGRYCSQWPPATDWDCYDVFHDGARGVRFVDDWDNESIGAFDE
jgi:hypothetical protein